MATAAVDIVSRQAAYRLKSEVLKTYLGESIQAVSS